MKGRWLALRTLLDFYPRMLRLVWQASPRYTALAIAVTLVSAAARPAQLWMTKLVIDQVLLAVQASTQAQAFDLSALATTIALMFLVSILVGVFQSLSESLRDLLAQTAGAFTDFLLLQKAAQMDVAFFETPSFFDRMQNARRDSWQARNIVFFGIDFMGALLALAGTLALLVRLHPLAVPVLLIAAMPQAVVRAYYATRQFKLWTRRAPAQRMVDYLGGLLGSREPVKEIRLFGLDSVFLARHRQYWQELLREIRQIKLAQASASAGLIVLSLVGTLAIWAYAAGEAILGRITIGDVALTFQAVEQARFGLSNLFWLAGALYEHSLFASNLFAFLDLAPDSVDGALARDHGDGSHPLRVPHPIRQGIEFRHVSFHYPGSERPILQDVSFGLHPGETMALVGENGAGKTTLVKLLARYYDPTDGVILLDGRDMREYDLEDLRRNIGVIFQDFVRYQLTARENIGFGQVEHVDDLTRVREAAQQGGAHLIVEKLPKGFETMLGRVFEDSVDLSGGEWQKLALGRAFMREAQVLILDEPTASLDALAEYEVYQRFAELTAGKATLFISHRFSTVRMAQHILVLHEGRLIEEGSHADLMTRAGEYAKMFNTQAERYR